MIYNAKIPVSQIVVNVVEDVDRRAFQPLIDIGVQVLSSPRVGDGRYCNKAGQIDNLIVFDPECVFLMDADMFICDSIQHLTSPISIRGKIVDLPNPQIVILQELYERAKFEILPKEVPVDHDLENLTFQGNLNGGLYIIPGRELKKIKRSWNKWIDWILDYPNSLDLARKLHHTDQIAFSMAAHELGIKIEHIDRSYNFPCHLPQHVDVEPIIWHYHQMLRDGVLLNVNPELPNYTRKLAQVNEQIQIWLEDL